MVGRKGNGSQNFVVFLTVKELDMKKFAFFFLSAIVKELDMGIALELEKKQTVVIVHPQARKQTSAGKRRE